MKTKGGTGGCDRISTLLPFDEQHTGVSVELQAHDFDTILHENKHAIFNLLFRLTGDFHLSEDLFQETFLKAYRSLGSYRGNAKLSTWIYSIALNVFRDHIRRNRWTHPFQISLLSDKSDFTSSESTPEEQYIANEERMDIQKRLMELKPAFRIPVVLYYIDGFSISRIAEITGRSQSDIKVSLHRARKVLQKRMALRI
jgi:RNA polymerase sigma-70 factor (ECF subfamily)